jgi:MFS family permease
LKLVFISIMALFMVGSLICAVAPNSPVFILGRALAGLGAGGQFAGTLTIIAHSVPLHRRATYTGGLSALYGVTPILDISHFRLPVLLVHCWEGCSQIKLDGDGVSGSTFQSAPLPFLESHYTCKTLNV